ncbi:MAG: polysaccharide deacetylase family protein, partial [Clostridia bacterium]
MKRFFIFGLTAAIIIFSAVMSRGAPQKKVAYITIDDGPTLNTPRIMETLKRHEAGAAFFVLKDRIETYPDYIRMMENEGFTIGLHGVSHNGDIYASPTSPLTEMNQTNEALYKLLGRRSYIVRTPYGSKPNLTDRQRELLETAGYKIFDWNVDPR